MPIDALRTIDIIEQLENFVSRLRPKNEETRKKLDFGYNIDDQSIFLLEIRPDWINPAVIRQRPFAKATYIKSRDIWKIFWIRANGKWYSYEPTPVIMSLKQFLEIVETDEHHCFFG